MKVGHGERLVMTWGQMPPIFSIGYDADAPSERDSGFSVLFDDAPDPDELVGEPGEDPRIDWLCLHCLIEDYPEVGRGLDLARRYGAADLVDGEWQGRSIEDD